MPTVPFVRAYGRRAPRRSCRRGTILFHAGEVALIPRLIASAATASGNTRESGASSRPARGAFVLGVDQQCDAADTLRDANAAIGRAQQESAAEAPALHRSIDAEAAETEHRHVV